MPVRFIRRNLQGLLAAVIAGVATLALAMPAAAPAYPADAHGVVTTTGAPVNARGTDVAAPDQQSPAPASSGQQSAVPAVNARGTDVAAPDQQSPAPASSGQQSAVPAVNARGTDVAAPDQQAPIPNTSATRTDVPAPDGFPAVFPILVLIALAGLALGSRLTMNRKRGRAAA